MALNQKIFIVIHSLFTEVGKPVSGTGSSLFELLRESKIPFSLLHLPIYGDRHVIMQEYAFGKVSSLMLRRTPSSLVFRTFIEFGLIFSEIKRRGVIDVYIGIDPLNALWGIVGKYVFKRIRRVIFYTADYADNRFNNPAVNWVYHYIDKLCVRYSDQVWNVSTRIHEKRKDMGVPDERNFFIPNAPVFNPQSITRYHKYWAIVVGTSTTALEYTALLDALSELIRKYPGFQLHIVGELHFPPTLERRIALMITSKHVILHGSMSRPQVLKLLAISGLGMALYKDKDPWTKYGDSMKIREYLSCGLPVLTTDVVSTSSVVLAYRCGKVIVPTAKNIIRAVSEIYSSDYSGFRISALSAAKHYSFVRMVRQPLSLMGITV